MLCPVFCTHAVESSQYTYKGGTAFADEKAGAQKPDDLLQTLSRARGSNGMQNQVTLTLRPAAFLLLCISLRTLQIQEIQLHIA